MAVNLNWGPLRWKIEEKYAFFRQKGEGQCAIEKYGFLRQTKIIRGVSTSVGSNLNISTLA